MLQQLLIDPGGEGSDLDIFDLSTQYLLRLLSIYTINLLETCKSFLNFIKILKSISCGDWVCGVFVCWCVCVWGGEGKEHSCQSGHEYTF